MKVRKIVSTFSGYDLDGTIDHAIHVLECERKEFGGDAQIDWDTLDPYSDTFSFAVSVLRDETPEEETRRLAAEEKHAEEQEARERKQFELLKKKFE
jgi:hypothetical protein